MTKWIILFTTCFIVPLITRWRMPLSWRKKIPINLNHLFLLFLVFIHLIPHLFEQTFIHPLIISLVIIAGIFFISLCEWMIHHHLKKEQNYFLVGLFLLGPIGHSVLDGVMMNQSSAHALSVLLHQIPLCAFLWEMSRDSQKTFSVGVVKLILFFLSSFILLGFALEHFVGIKNYPHEIFILLQAFFVGSLLHIVLGHFHHYFKIRSS